MSAIRITGDGTGMRIQLDIPESDMPEAIKLMLYRQCALKVTIEPQSSALQPVKQKPKSEQEQLDDLLEDIDL